MIMYAKSAASVYPILPVNFIDTIFRFLWVHVIQNVPIMVSLCCVL